jgi:hypothetical protein
MRITVDIFPMKLPRRSLAYYWARFTLNRKPPSWAPLFSIGLALIFGFLWFSQDGKSSSLLVAAVCALLGAAEAWHLQGVREILSEQERLLEDARKEKNA